ncbi:TPA: hypothetical protein KQE75_004123 [Clostridioides difficile]|nr:hypothetical protein [Clostridioides difficile]MDI3074812.1 hypothetical protein [Clostridioides difficile]MDK3168042.1 hypothetical protein [Clostridioides difficile]MDW0076987.1 hypothetical protein [Clostridioides difficile]HBG4630839.1 hypothetical protein [Clostridioides difficile]
MKFRDFFRYEIANKCLYDEDKCVVIKCNKCSLGEICLQICDELEKQDRL